MVGASGAVFGILLAFAMLFPNMQLMLLIPRMDFMKYGVNSIGCLVIM